jgi:ribosomal-protein-alanine N-acetyltransferase
MTTKHKIKVALSKMKERDIPGALLVEEASFEFPWTEEDFVKCLDPKDLNCHGKVFYYEGKIIAFMIYKLEDFHIDLINLAIDPNYRRCGIGSQMIANLIERLTWQRWRRLIVEVRETNLTAQLFFRKNKLRAISTLYNHYEHTPEDAYVMQIWCPKRNAWFRRTELQRPTRFAG